MKNDITRNIRFFFQDAWKIQDLEVSSNLLNFPGTNTKTRNLNDKWKTLRGNNQFIRTFTGFNVSMQGAFIFGHNIPEAVPVILKATNAGDWNNPDFEVTMSWFRHVVCYIQEEPATFNDWGIFIDGNPVDSYEIGRIYLSRWWEPENGYRGKGIHENPVDPTNLLINPSGFISTIDRETYKSWSLPFDRLDKIEFKTFIESVGKTNPFVIQKKVSGNPLAYLPDMCYYVRVSEYNYQNIAVDQFYQATIGLIEQR